MKITVLDGYTLNPGDLDWSCLDEFGEVTLFERTGSEEEAIRRIGDAEIVLTNKTPITESILNACPSIRLICVLATGYNVVDTAAAKERNIPVCNVPTYGTDAVAQFTIALLLELCHRVGLHSDLVHQGEWSRCPDFTFWRTPQMELAGKTMGIIGFGKIGRAVGRIAKALGMRVLACNPSRCDEGAAIGTYTDLDTLLRESDVVSLHCPLFPSTKGIIGPEALGKMKNGSILLNTSRGPLLDETAVAQALRSGKLRSAAVDVVSTEPISRENPLLEAPNCLITPHMAWTSRESRVRLLACVADNIRAYLNGTPQNVVN